MRNVSYQLDARSEAELSRAVTEKRGDGEMRFEAALDGVSCQARVSFDGWTIDGWSIHGQSDEDAEERGPPGYEAGARALLWLSVVDESTSMGGLSRQEIAPGEGGARVARGLLDDAMEAAASQLGRTAEFLALIEARELDEAAPAAAKAKGPARSI